jgi:hypothetical protein
MYLPETLLAIYEMNSKNNISLEPISIKGHRDLWALKIAKNDA